MEGNLEQAQQDAVEEQQPSPVQTQHGPEMKTVAKFGDGGEEQPSSLEQTGSDLEKKIVIKFGEKGNGEGQFNIAKEIALSSDGFIAVVEHGHERVYLFAQDGTYQSTMKSDDEKREAKLLYPTDVTFTSDGQIAVVDQTSFVKIFNKDGDFLHSFTIRGKTESRAEKPKAYSIDVTSDAQILVGDVRRKVITMHAVSGDKCEWLRKVNLNIEPHFLATTFQNGRHQVLVCDWKAGLVNAIDLAVEDKDDNVIFELDNFKVDGFKGLPKGLAYDNNGHFFIAVSRLDDSSDNSNTTKNVFANTGHIHQYSSCGKFELCLFRGLSHPRGMTWFNGRLYIANTRSIAILHV